MGWNDQARIDTSIIHFLSNCLLWMKHLVSSPTHLIIVCDLSLFEGPFFSRFLCWFLLIQNRLNQQGELQCARVDSFKVSHSRDISMVSGSTWIGEQLLEHGRPESVADRAAPPEGTGFIFWSDTLQRQHGGHFHSSLCVYANIFVFQNCKMGYSYVFMKHAVRGQTWFK